QLNDPQAQAATLLSLGNFHRYQRDLPQAIALYKQAAELAVDPLLRATASLNRLSTLLDPERQQLFAARRLRLDLQTQLASLPPSSLCAVRSPAFYSCCDRPPTQHSR
ncbi:MAG: tetratricopeptide repeat-containing protein, partial [Coleofasciculaceae cyanobacterium SM2_3_26]|nr:tetratricopeptide repeat-containing protein [Coleofasciculaceae cyanobacterium SM2_3_26]